MMVRRTRHSHVFLVRTWAEARGEHRAEMRGMVRNVHSGETRYFHTWGDLVAFIEREFAEQERRVNQDDGTTPSEPESGG